MKTKPLHRMVGLPDTELGRLVGETDWSRTELGPVAEWPDALSASVRLCLSSRFPMLVCWGPDLVMVYNDGYRTVLGELRHPTALGAASRDVWGDVWHQVAPMLEGIIAGDPATWSEDLPMVMERSGYTEEAYFTFSFSPIVDDAGEVGGVLCVTTETTDRVLAERRTRTQLALAGALVGAATLADVRSTAESVLSGNVDDHGPVRVLLGADSEVDPGPAAEVPGGPTAAIHRLPIVEPARGEVVGWLVLAESPRRPWDEAVQAYAALSAAHIGAAVGGILRLEAEHQRAEALAQMDAAKSVFLANVSHELRTPLTLIAAPALDALADESVRLAPEQRQRLEVVLSNTDRLGVLVDRLLDASRLDAGAVVARRVETDVTGLLRGLASSFRPAIEHAGLRFSRRCATLPEVVHTDPEMLERVVLNLLTNALRYTSEGSVQLRLRPVTAGFEVAVEDTGAGIPEESLGTIFERFEQLPEHRAGRPRAGAGIGLSLVRQLTELMGGRISVRSEVGRGSCFSVFLPYGSPDPGAPPQERSISTGPAEAMVRDALRWVDDGAEPQAPVSTTDVPRPVLLLVEDDPEMRSYLAGLLGEDYDVLSVPDGVAGLEAAGRVAVDLVLADVMMPRLGGLGLVRALRAEPATSGVPVVLLSAQAGVESSASGLAEGADDYVAKPFAPADLKARLAANLARARARSRDGAWRRVVLSALRDPLVITDDEGTVVELNEAFTRTFGWDLSAGPIGRPYPWWVDPSEDPEATTSPARAFEALRSGERVFDESRRFRRRDGSIAWVSVAAAMVPESSVSPALILGVIRDETRAREALVRRTLAARVADELTGTEDFAQALSAVVTGLSILFEGDVMVRYADEHRDVILTRDGPALPDELDPALRDLLSSAAAEPPDPSVLSAAARRRMPAGSSGHDVSLVPGLLISAATSGSRCAVWVEFERPRVVSPDEHVVGDLLAQAFVQAADRVAVHHDLAVQERHLKLAIESHRMIGHAVGVLMERHRVTADQGFAMLRQASLDRNIKLREIARRVMETGLEPTES
ncbi:MAG: ATP-binding protein [Terracoccus sp.]